jgi:hypothetical protein
MCARLVGLGPRLRGDDKLGYRSPRAIDGAPGAAPRGS